MTQKTTLGKPNSLGSKGSMVAKLNDRLANGRLAAEVGEFEEVQAQAGLKK